MELLVTGGCGFIGANLVPMLRRQGHNVTILDNFTQGSPEYLDLKTEYKIIHGDIRDDDLIYNSLIKKDAVIHLAAYGSVVDSVQAPEENYSVNAEGTFKVLNAARKAGVRKVVFASTGGALIGNAAPPVNEKSIPRPISPYGASKLAGEGYCSAFSNAYDMSVTALRFANVVGPISLHKKGAVTAFFKSIIEGKAIRIFGDGSATRDFLYVGDLCQGIIAGLESNSLGFNVYHLASGKEVSVKQLAEISLDVTGANNIPILFEAKRVGEVERNFANYDLAKEDLGWEPVVALEDALSVTWDWFQDYYNT